MSYLKNGEFTVTLNGINHWVKIEGAENQTIPLILIHGGPGGNHYVFERTAGPLLAKSRTIVYYEQRGCGRSDKPSADDQYSIDELTEDFKELKKWLGVGKVDLLGYSFGGELALEITHSFPEEIHHLILSAPSLLHTDVQKMVQITGFMSIGVSDLFNRLSEHFQTGATVEEIYNEVWEMVSPEIVDLLLFEDQEVARENRGLWEESDLVNTGLMSRALTNSPVAVPLLDRLKEIQHQTLILTGVFDRNTGVPISKLIHSNLPNCRLVLFGKSAHFPDLEETNKFVKEINMFFDYTNCIGYPNKARLS
ncbi:alpha/beta fold hydrolase [Rossellomorea sp. KS-H15a]|jgi:proline iminopeptidase|uniref:alpha/beta fold hydrolase n=1 Tax=Rossellomorea sp. KS-H15a TaxID=2963940 RepID=UPI0020C661F5|nr:alpha/beta fold hydrolase [Rossellomorea sp. KS-H15a]UTE78661.1 alpha/beta fold hydrolase [Rossellomorea sp. KS-H15a]